MTGSSGDKVSPQDANLENSPIDENDSSVEDSIEMEAESNSENPVLCYWNGVAYSPGMYVCAETSGSFERRMVCRRSGAWRQNGWC